MWRWLLDLVRRRTTVTLLVDTRNFVDIARAVQGDVPLRDASRIDVVASLDVTAHWLQQVPVSLASMAELRQAAAVRCAQLFGKSPHDWWVTGQWRVDRPFVCAALPRAFVDQVEEELGDLRDRARWSSAFGAVVDDRSQHLPTNGWACLRAASIVVLWHMTRGEIDSIESLRTAPGEDDIALNARVRQHIAVEEARRGLAQGADVHWVDGVIRQPSMFFERAAGFRSLAFGGSSRLATAVASFAVLIAMAGLVAVTARAQEDSRLMADQQAELARLQSMRAPKVAAAKSAREARELRALGAVAQQLNTPWSQLLDALEASLPDAVALVSIEPRGATGKVRIQAEARTLDALLAYAATLRQTPLFASVDLVKHETNEQDANRPVRLTLDAEFTQRHAAERAPR